MKYAVLSDQHAHKWSQFSSVDKDGMNTRLKHILQEMERAADELIKSGGDTMIFAGDLFHIRGSISPEVFNPTFQTIRNILNRGIQIYAIPGNHDLAERDTTELGNAIQTLGALPGFNVITKPKFILTAGGPIGFIPWYSKIDALKAAVDILIEETDVHPDEYDLIMHAGIEGVITGLDHGLTAAEVAGWGFKRVFAGHYHNHKIMEDGKVISIGALTHQSFSDVGTKAGFLLVDHESVTYRASHAPQFMDISAMTPEEEIPLRADGNYVRVRDMKLTDADIVKMRKQLLDMGARGVAIQVAREVVSARSGTPAKTSTLEESVSKFIDDMEIDEAAAVKASCEAILKRVQALAS